MIKEVHAFDYAAEICKAIPKGVLVTTKADGKVNTMTIGWGHIGTEWGRPIFVAYIRESRYTRKMLEGNGEFTVNIPMGDYDSRITKICGTRSGRDLDKISELGLHLEDSPHVSVPGIRELPLTLECKVIYTQLQDLNAMPAQVIDRYYPANENGAQDDHIAFYGEITGAYLIDG